MNQDDPGSDFTENGTARYDQEHTQTTSESGRRTSADADRPEKPNIFRQVQTAQFLFGYYLDFIVCLLCSIFCYFSWYRWRHPPS
jgi:hypothetical protein